MKFELLNLQNRIDIGSFRDYNLKWSDAIAALRYDGKFIIDNVGRYAETRFARRLCR
jgi:hypothetical protein